MILKVIDDFKRQLRSDKPLTCTVHHQKKIHSQYPDIYTVHNC